MSNPKALTQEEVIALLDNAHQEEAVLHDKVVLIDYEFEQFGGFTVTGRAGLVNKADFDIEIGRRLAKEDAARQLWRLLAFKMAAD